jgi:hypothetical protein
MPDEVVIKMVPTSANHGVAFWTRFTGSCLFDRLYDLLWIDGLMTPQNAIITCSALLSRLVDAL